MIKKLRIKIFWLIMVSFSVIMLGIIFLFAFLNYNNTVHTTKFMKDKFVGEPRKNPVTRPVDENIRKEFDEAYLEFREDAKLHIRKTLIVSVIASIVSLIVIYVVAKRVSETIVKPVQETFEGQKQFISDASHELKTPLAVIEANVDVLENEIGTNKWMTYIKNETESMDKLINELLLLAKIENIDNLRECKPLDISKEVELILSMFESMAYEKQVKLKSNLQENIIMNANKEDLENIVSVLVDNAIKHTEKEVVVDLKREKNEVILEVKNVGEPIPEEEKEKIFERFYRIDKARNRKEKRYGLGLAIAKSTVEKYNGKIEVGSKENYTIFKVIFPN